MLFVPDPLHAGLHDDVESGVKKKKKRTKI